MQDIDREIGNGPKRTAGTPSGTRPEVVWDALIKPKKIMGGNRRLSIEESGSFFEKVQLYFQLINLLIQVILLCVSLLADLLAAIGEDIRQTSQGLFLPTPHLCRVNTEYLCDLGRCLVRLDRFHRRFSLEASE